MMWNGHGYWGGGEVWAWLMFVLMVVIVAAVVVGIIFLLRGLAQPGGRPGAPVPPTDSAKEILRRRYAAGEIDREEYLQKLSDL